LPLREAAAAASNATSLADAEVLQLLGAIAHAPPLGRALWRYAYAGQERAGIEARWLLVHEAMRRWKWPPTALLGHLAALAVLEWSNRQCLRCDGRGEYVGAQLRVMCELCHGTGLRRHSNRARREFMRTVGEAWSEPTERRLHRLLDVLTATDTETAGIVRRQLGWAPALRGGSIERE
jgi:hypothetical protein